MDKAKRLETSIKGLSVTVGDDGVWLNFEAKGLHASINMSSYGAARENKIIGDAILKWSIQTAIEAAQQSTDTPEPLQIIHGELDELDKPYWNGETDET